MLAVTSVSWDPSLLEMLLPLTTGAMVLVMPWEVVVDGLALAKALPLAAPDALMCTPTLLNLILEGGWQGNFPAFCSIIGPESGRRTRETGTS